MTSIVALVFLVPLGITLQQDTRREALADAARRSAVVVGALTATADPKARQRAVAGSSDDPARRVVVHGLDLGGRDRADQVADPDPRADRLGEAGGVHDPV
ncbi:two-component sensor histidine kinase, partial [Micromonospora zhanjiangensis]